MVVLMRQVPSAFRGLVYRLDNSCGIAHNHSVVRHILGDDASSADNSVLANRHARHDGYVGSYLCASLDMHRLADDNHAVVEVVVNRDDAHLWRYLHIVVDGDAGGC